jgi:anaerobic selenocysteine-containing dehydrogenase
MAQLHQTYCRNCPSLCGLMVEVENNKILSIVGDQNHPMSKGYCCIKGQASQDLHNGEDRLISSRKGRGADQADIGVDRALDEIHDKLSSIINRNGPRAVALYYGTGANNHSLCHSAMKGWLHLVGSPYVFSSMTLDQSAKWVTMGRMGWFATGKHSIVDADVGMLVGCNPAVSHTGLPVVPLQNPRRWLRDAKRRGVKLIVIDPRVTETARFADLHLQIKPGEDAVLFAGMIRIVLERGWEDRAFCERFVAPLDGLRVAVADFTLAYVAARTGLEPARIEAAAEMFARAKRPTGASGTGPNMSPGSNLAEHLIEAFSAICGAYRRAGDLVRNTGLLYGTGSVTEMAYPAMRPWEHGAKLRTADIGAMFGEFPSALLPDEITAQGEDRIRALIVVGGNPAKAIVDPTKSLPALRELELLVSLDIRHTETTAISDYVIATSLSYERHDYTGIYDPMLTMSFAQVATPFIQRPADIIDDWEFFWGLSKRMNRLLELKIPLFGAPHDQIPGSALKLDMTTKPATQELIRWLAGQGGASYDDLLAHPEGVLRDEMVTIVQPAGVDDGVRLDVFPPDVAQELATVKSLSPAVDFKYLLIVRRMLETMNSAYRNASKTRNRYPVNPAFMNPSDMEQEGIVAASAVDIVSDHGAVVAYVSPDAGLRRGVIGMAHSWGSLDSASDPEGLTGAYTGRLISLQDHRESINFMPRQSAVPVNVTVRTSPC